MSTFLMGHTYSDNIRWASLLRHLFSKEHYNLNSDVRGALSHVVPVSPQLIRTRTTPSRACFALPKACVVFGGVFPIEHQIRQVHASPSQTSILARQQ
jgi:hypothetical protein